MTRSASRMASAGDSAKRAPFLANGLHFSALRFQTVSLYPALRRFDAMPPPMVPRPRKEIVVIITTDLFTVSSPPPTEKVSIPGLALEIRHERCRPPQASRRDRG